MFGTRQQQAMVLILLAVMIARTQCSIINAYPEDANSLTCWTCKNMSNNTACNNWAPDVQCTGNNTICQTVHRVDTRTGQSVSVYKRCALPSQCSGEHVGCHKTHIPYVKECISCCDTSLCNKFSPTNYSTAWRYSSISASRPVHTVCISLVLLGLTVARTMCYNVF